MTLASTCPVGAFETGPQGIVRQFCRADALGQRANLRDWPLLAPIISWPFEPAWDFAVLISGYEVGSPHAAENGALDIDVQYTVVGQVSAFGLETGPQVETVTFHVDAGEAGWRIAGPPPAPHIFGTRVDVEAMTRSFENGTPTFLPDSLFIWQMVRSSGWNVAYQRTADLLAGITYRPVEKPQVGDVVVYLHDGVPYHAGLLEAEQSVISSSLNAGIVHTAVDAFPGEVHYVRLVEPEPAPTPEFVPLPRPLRRATPVAARVTRRRGSPKPGAQPSTRRRVKRKSGAAARTPRPTPVARDETP